MDEDRPRRDLSRRGIREDCAILGRHGTIWILDNAKRSEKEHELTVLPLAEGHPSPAQGSCFPHQGSPFQAHRFRPRRRQGGLRVCRRLRITHHQHSQEQWISLENGVDKLRNLCRDMLENLCLKSCYTNISLLLLWLPRPFTYEKHIGGSVLEHELTSISLITVSPHTSAVSLNCSATPRTSVPVSSQRRGYV